jgi:hypothetical protein
MKFQTVKDLGDFLESEKRIERRYTWIFLGTMIACFIVGILIGQRVGGL